MHRLCDLEALAPGQALAVEVSGLGVLLVGTVDGPRAFHNVCPHQGRSLDFAPGEFLFTRDGRLVCPHHGAAFELPSGTCVQGPCEGDGLREIALIEQAGGLWMAG